MKTNVIWRGIGISTITREERFYEKEGAPRKGSRRMKELGGQVPGEGRKELEENVQGQEHCEEERIHDGKRKRRLKEGIYTPLSNIAALL
jgi:hypothetical protein